ncbi:MAG TPA: hypothetical protein VLX56_06305 [Nitrososphaerales archaeon]|nr:hypothetical protein [Nitrososphaerales archaeon]
MLEFRVHQLYLASLERFFLPLPKMSQRQEERLSAHLEARGFAVRTTKSNRVAQKGRQRISVNAKLGLASSTDDMLDALAPAVPEILASAGAGVRQRDVSSRYFSLRASRGSTTLRVFPRMESSRIWSGLRQEGLCGLTPDEAVALRRVLAVVPSGAPVRCLTSNAREGSRRVQFGRRTYYSSVLPVKEFLSSLTTIESRRPGSGAYLPREALLDLPGRVEAELGTDDVGEWCA